MKIPEEPRGRYEVLSQIHNERDRQDRKWGEQNHDPFKWLAILGEEVGEVNNALLEACSDKYTKINDLEEYRKELIQVAAVAVSMIECLDRKIWRSK